MWDSSQGIWSCLWPQWVYTLRHPKIKINEMVFSNNNTGQAWWSHLGFQQTQADLCELKTSCGYISTNKQQKPLEKVRRIFWLWLEVIYGDIVKEASFEGHIIGVGLSWHFSSIPVFVAEGYIIKCILEGKGWSFCFFTCYYLLPVCFCIYSPLVWPLSIGMVIPCFCCSLQLQRAVRGLVSWFLLRVGHHGGF